MDSHADLLIGVDRPDPVHLLAIQDETRVRHLVPIRHARMRVTPFTFYRGAAAIMASDLSRVASTGLRVQLCGDAHLSNFGVFKGPDRRLVFDVNDFDETTPGPFEWDLKRLATSVTIAARHNEHTAADVRSATRAAVRQYRETLAETLNRSPLDVHYQRIEVESVLREEEGLRRRSERALAKATRKDSMRALAKLTELVDGRRRIMASPPLVVPLAGFASERAVTRDRLLRLFARYRASLPPHRAAVLDRYRFVDLAHKVVGVGSVGTRCFIVLLESGDGAPLFLQFKEAGRSVLEPYVGPSEFEHGGERVVRGQQLMQAASDILLGFSHDVSYDGRVIAYYFRQLWDGKGSAEVEQMGPKRLKNYARHCAAALAVAHARSGDAAAIAGYLGDDRAVDEVFAEFARRYADLNEKDHAAHEAAIVAGRLPAVGPDDSDGRGNVGGSRRDARE